jgi:hypothetical protein
MPRQPRFSDRGHLGRSAPVEAYRNPTNRDASSDGARISALGGGFVRTRYSFSLGMAISRDGGERDDVLREHHLSFGFSFDDNHLCAAPGSTNVSCPCGGSRRPRRRRFRGYGFCNALHERLAAVCSDLVRASNRFHVYVWSIDREACAALVAL